MDIRIEKTDRAIRNAFLELRSKRALEKITVKELCTMAQINKSTFYSHFQDIYDLSDKLQAETIGRVMDAIATDPEFTVADSVAFTRSLFNAILAQSALIEVLFSGKEQGGLIQQLEIGIKELVFREYPAFRYDLEKQMVLSYSIYGGYHTYQNYRDHDDITIFRVIEKITATIQPLYSSGMMRDGVS